MSSRRKKTSAPTGASQATISADNYTFSMMQPKTSSAFGRTSVLEELGLSKQILVRIVEGSCDSVPRELLPDSPSYGVLFELLYFSRSNAKLLKFKPNKILKCLVDTLFPLCSVSRGDRLERRIETLFQPLFKLSTQEEQVEYLQRKWKPQATGVQKVEVTEEMESHHLNKEIFLNLLSNPKKNKWVLRTRPSVKFYADLHYLLKQRRIPLKEIGYIYRSIDHELQQSTKDNKDAYEKIKELIERNQSSEIHIHVDSVLEQTHSGDEQQYLKRNVKRRELRARNRIQLLQKSLKHFKKREKKQRKEINILFGAIHEYSQTLWERNREIRTLKNDILSLQQTLDLLDFELQDARQDEMFADAKHATTQTVRLKRYVGSRYYITSYNAARIFFLRNAMLAFLQEQKLLKKLNYLESTCLRKLNDNLLLTKLHLEGLIYDKVYCDLMTLVKSKDLDKSSLQMNIHYQELLQFLQNLASVPRLILDSEVFVFLSEPRLYSPDSKLNHRLHTPYIAVRNELYDQAFNVACSNQSLLLKMTSLVGHAMATKLKSYKCDHLPGGKYFSPEAKTKSILSSLRPHNDMAESVFGSNDWLSYALPNMVQATRSVLIEFSYNKTMEWLKDQSKDQRELLISLAQARRRIAEREKKLEKENLLEQKIQNRIEAVEKAKLAQQKHVAVVTELESEQLISSPKELEQRINYIKALSLSRVLQENELKSVVKRQMKLRRFVYHQNTRISFTYNGKAKPVNELLTELSNVIASYPTLVRVRRKDSPSYQQLFTIFDKPSYLTRAKFKHQFEVDGDLQWFEGCIQKYVKNYFTLCYDTNEQCVFSLDEIKEDFYNGDFWII